jgi:hypothetical protein
MGCGSLLQSSAPQSLDIDALKWIGDTADPLAHLLTEPVSCVGDKDNAAVKRGELLFESPLLLGGQAAKVGLSCAACHRNGRDNPDFFLVGISGAPGTADVTNGFFSKQRADDDFNPVPIPDLASAGGRTRVDRREAGRLEKFLAAQVVEEFEGQPPQQMIVDDLAAYIRALDHGNCDPDQTRSQSWRDELELLRAAASHINEDASPADDAYIDAMRAALGRLNARFQSTESEAVREYLVTLSRQLQNYPDMTVTDRDLKSLEDQLLLLEPYSFYQRETLAAALR